MIRFVGPPAVRNPERSFPKLADPEDEKPGDGEGAPVDKLKSDPGAEKAGDDTSREEK